MRVGIGPKGPQVTGHHLVEVPVAALEVKPVTEGELVPDLESSRVQTANERGPRRASSPKT
jgi:hypothetical protein